MRIYLDMCCLKRPFDDQSQARVHLESEALFALLAASGEPLEFVHAPAHDLENERNPSPARAARVGEWLAVFSPVDPPEGPLGVRIAELLSLGFKNLDALHLASAEAAGTAVFVTCDDRLLGAARRHAAHLRVRVLTLIELAAEVFP